MNPHTYPAARLTVVGRVLNRTEQAAQGTVARIGWQPPVVRTDWVLDVRDADPRIPLVGPTRYVEPSECVDCGAHPCQCSRFIPADL